MLYDLSLFHVYVYIFEYKHIHKHSHINVCMCVTIIQRGNELEREGGDKGGFGGVGQVRVTEMQHSFSNIPRSKLN